MSYTTKHTAQQHPTETAKSFNIVSNRTLENLEKIYMENVQLAYFQWIYSMRCVSFVESAHRMKEKFLWNLFIKNICLIISINGSMLNKISDQIEYFNWLAAHFQWNNFSNTFLFEKNKRKNIGNVVTYNSYTTKLSLDFVYFYFIRLLGSRGFFSWAKRALIRFESKIHIQAR